jgi:hypothetical protein
LEGFHRSNLIIFLFDQSAYKFKNQRRIGVSKGQIPLYRPSKIIHHVTQSHLNIKGGTICCTVKFMLATEKMVETGTLPPLLCAGVQGTRVAISCFGTWTRHLLNSPPGKGRLCFFKIFILSYRIQNLGAKLVTRKKKKKTVLVLKRCDSLSGRLGASL